MYKYFLNEIDIKKLLQIYRVSWCDVVQILNLHGNFIVR